MAEISLDERGTGARTVACPSCAAPLMHDQRYCLQCGARRGALPPGIERQIAALQHPGLEEAAAAAAPLEDDAGLGGFAMPTPRATAAAVLAILGFGVIVGSLFSVSQPSAENPVLVEANPPAHAASSTTPLPAAPAAAVRAQPVPPAPGQAPAAAPQQQAAVPPTAPIASKPPPFPSTSLPPVKHVFMIVLSSQGYNQAFGPSSQAPYLAHTLTSQGELLVNYYGVAGGELANEIALISGQGPTNQTVANCPTYSDVAPGSTGDMGQVTGDGCVFPATTPTLPDELAAGAKTWKAYVEDIGNGGAGQAATCRHPGLGQADDAATPQPGDAYVTWRDPFVYFHSLIDASTCASTVVGLDQLAPDLQTGSSDPSLSYIVPNRCHDGSDQPCAPGQPSGLPAADAFLQSVVPEITTSAAYKDGGLIAITFDQAPQTGPNADQSTCCSFPVYPNVPPVPPSPPGPVHPAGGGGQVGLLLISPFVQPGSVNRTSYFNHYSLLASIEDLFGVQTTGYAADPAIPVFDQTVYNATPAAPSGKGATGSPFGPRAKRAG